jgi:hypothetical protein
MAFWIRESCLREGASDARPHVVARYTEVLQPEGHVAADGLCHDPGQRVLEQKGGSVR